MDTEKRSTRFGAAIIIFAAVLRLAGGILTPPVRALRLPQRKDALTATDIGQIYRFPGFSAAQPTTIPTQPTEPPPTQPPAPERPRFTAADAALAQIRYASDCGYRPDVAALLEKPLDWSLAGDAPTVLIIHSHASESYTLQSGENDPQWSDYRTLNERYNMVAVGDLLTQLLEAGGVRVLHDRQIHDYPSYNDAYTNSRASVEEYLAQYPSIQMVLDLHRDAALNGDGSQYATSALVDGERSAQLMFVMGTNAAGAYHPQWQENLSIALKLQVLLEKRAPGISRTTILRAQRFNQDVAMGAMIVEVGTAGNTQTEVFRAIPVLAEAILALMNGAQ